MNTQLINDYVEKAIRKQIPKHEIREWILGIGWAVSIDEMKAIAKKLGVKL